MKNKKTTKLVAGLLLAGSIFGGCKKDEVKNTDSKTKSTMRNPDPFVYYNYGVDIIESDIISNPEDVDDENYNKVEFALSLCMKELYTNHTATLNSLIQSVNSTNNKCFNLLTFAQQNPSVNTHI